MCFLNSLRYVFLSCLYFLTVNATAQTISFGDVVRIRHLASQQCLAASEKSFMDGQFDVKQESNHRNKELSLKKTADFESLWIIKSEHVEDLRWGQSLGQAVSNKDKIRLENLATHCNLHILQDAKGLVAAKNIAQPQGVCAREDNLRCDFCSLEGVLEDSKERATINLESNVWINFTDLESKNFILHVDEQNNLKVANELEPSVAKNSVWRFELVEKNFAQKENIVFENSIKDMRARKDFIETSSSVVSNLSIWQDKEATKFLIGATENIDGRTYLSSSPGLDSISSKLDKRLCSLSLQDENSFWACDKQKKIYTAKIKGLTINEWISVPGLAENVFAAENNHAYRLSSCGWNLFKINTTKTGVASAEKPALSDVVSAAALNDGSLWWIDLDGNVQQKLLEQSETIFSHVSPSHPKFVKISAAGNVSNNFVALLRSDGQLFVAQNNAAFFNVGLNQVMDVSIGQAGKIAVVMRVQNSSQGPIFKTDFKDTLKTYQENKKKYAEKFESPADFLTYYQYHFELVPNSDFFFSELITVFVRAVEPWLEKLKQTDDFKKFYRIKLEPAAKKLSLTTVARQAFQKLKNELEESLELKDEKQTVSTTVAQEEKTAAKALSSMQADKEELENKLFLMQQEVEKNYARIDELETENKTLRLKTESNESQAIGIPARTEHSDVLKPDKMANLDKNK